MMVSNAGVLASHLRCCAKTTNSLLPNMPDGTVTQALSRMTKAADTHGRKWLEKLLKQTRLVQPFNRIRARAEPRSLRGIDLAFGIPDAARATFRRARGDHFHSQDSHRPAFFPHARRTADSNASAHECNSIGPR